jgi:hypothetical protein
VRTVDVSVMVIGTGWLMAVSPPSDALTKRVTLPAFGPAVKFADCPLLPSREPIELVRDQE